MQCAIYALTEFKKRRKMEKGGVLVLARYHGMLVFERGESGEMWRLPQGAKVRGEDESESARRILGKALGEAEYDVEPLCGYGVTGEDGKERGGVAYIADVRAWPGEITCRAKPFARMPLSSQIEDAALVNGLYRWAGAFFDERLDLGLLGDVTSR